MVLVLLLGYLCSKNCCSSSIFDLLFQWGLCLLIPFVFPGSLSLEPGYNFLAILELQLRFGNFGLTPLVKFTDMLI